MIWTKPRAIKDVVTVHVHNYFFNISYDRYQKVLWNAASLIN